MCGIAGIFFADSARLPDPATLQAMGDAIAHRGPDGSGYLIEPGVGLVHRRLAIIDLEGGRQPLGNEDGSVQIVFNGEIYNYPRWQRELSARGHRLQTQSDTETLVHLYEELGDQLVGRLRGMFAFAIWDRKKRHLLLARDRLGIKPLYVYRDTEKCLFASELKAILAWPGLPAAIDPKAIEDYFAFGYVGGSRSIIRGIEKLPPAHTLLLTPERLLAPPRRYWQLQLQPDESLDAATWQESLVAKLDETVRAHMIADVPVGAFLSGGLDSSAIAALAQSASTEPLKTFTIGFHEEEFSELPYARRVATHLGTDHFEAIIAPDAIDLFEKLSLYFDEPFADPSAMPSMLLARQTARQVKVALSGDGGDEAFGGYARYAHDLQEDRYRQALHHWLRYRILGPLGRIWPKTDWLPKPLRLKTRLTNLSLDPESAYANTVTLCRQPLRRRLLRPEVAKMLDGYDCTISISSAFRDGLPGDPLSGMIAADVGTVLPDDFLVKVDRASMAHGLEVRPPLLDHELMEMAARIPSRWKVHQGQTKWIFKEAMSPCLPAGIAHRRKQGFDLPVDAWLRGPLASRFEDAVLDRRAPIAQWIHPPMVRSLFQEHRHGRGRHGRTLWACLILSDWLTRYRL